MADAPMMPAPPALFSITIGTLSSLESPSAKIRVPTSMRPPGPNGTMMVMGFEGKS